MRILRQWAVSNAGLVERFYEGFESLLIKLAPVMNRIGHDRLETPVAALEKIVKGALFDCQMCGQCALSKTGMSCPMNCPKSIRNGPCGGVREGGYCEVEPEMKCVWVEGWRGASKTRAGDEIKVVQFAVDHRLKGQSSWLHLVREKTATQPECNEPARSSSS